jgi:hypothetical protein
MKLRKWIAGFVVGVVLGTAFVIAVQAQVSPSDLPRFFRIPDTQMDPHTTHLLDVRWEIYDGEPLRAAGHIWWDPAKVIVFSAQPGDDLEPNHVFSWWHPIPRACCLDAIWQDPPTGFEGWEGLRFQITKLGGDFNAPGPWFPWQAYLLDPVRYAQDWSVMKLFVHALDEGPTTLHVDLRTNGPTSWSGQMSFIIQGSPVGTFRSAFYTEDVAPSQISRPIIVNDAHLQIGGFVGSPMVVGNTCSACGMEVDVPSSIGPQPLVAHSAWSVVKELYR